MSVTVINWLLFDDALGNFMKHLHLLHYSYSHDLLRSILNSATNIVHGFKLFLLLHDLTSYDSFSWFWL